jgi:hypothetical protein
LRVRNSLITQSHLSSKWSVGSNPWGRANDFKGLGLLARPHFYFSGLLLRCDPGKRKKNGGFPDEDIRETPIVRNKGATYIRN